MNVGIVLDRQVDSHSPHDLGEAECWGSGNKFLARSNFQVENRTCGPLHLRIFDPDSRGDDKPMSEFVIGLGQRKSLPLPLLLNPSLQYALFCHVSKSWLKRQSLMEIVCADEGCTIAGTYVLHTGSSLLSDTKTQRYLMDHVIEVSSGFTLVNALPYWVEVKYFLPREGSAQASGMALREERLSLGTGQEAVLPISMQFPDTCAIRMRIVSSSSSSSSTNGFGQRNRPSSTAPTAARRRASHSGEDEKWSDEILLSDIFNERHANSVEADVVIPTYYSNAVTEMKVLKIRDARKENLRYVGQRASTAMVIVYVDVWIQNNSGIPLAYKAKTTGGDVLRTSDHEAGKFEVGAMWGESGGDGILFGLDANIGIDLAVPKHGPVLAPLDTKYLRLKLGQSGSRPFKNVTSLQRFNGVDVQPPIVLDSGKSSSKIYLSAGFQAEIRTGNMWLGVSVKRAPGVFSRSYIVVVTPRYVLQNLTSLDIMVFPLRVLRATTMNSLLTNRSTEEDANGMHAPYYTL
jgi:hypothetical protein